MKSLRPKPTEVGATFLAAGLIALCCGAPFLVAAAAATGVGAWFLSQGVPALGVVAVLAGAGLTLLWLRGRRGIALAGRRVDCCTPTDNAKQEKS